MRRKRASVDDERSSSKSDGAYGSFEQQQRERVTSLKSKVESPGVLKLRTAGSADSARSRKRRGPDEKSDRRARALRSLQPAISTERHVTRLEDAKVFPRRLGRLGDLFEAAAGSRRLAAAGPRACRTPRMASTAPATTASRASSQLPPYDISQSPFRF